MAWIQALLAAVPLALEGAKQLLALDHRTLLSISTRLLTAKRTEAIQVELLWLERKDSIGGYHSSFCW
jgi:hypothetical protein